MRLTRVAALAAVVFVPLAASAADLPVTYTVQEKPFKAAVAGTPLTFELYNDSVCTHLVASVAVPVEDITLISKLKLFTPKGGTKLPNTVELRTKLTTYEDPSSDYSSLALKVIGAAVVPVGGACQAQVADAGVACTPDQVAVGADCVDKYEASVWEIPSSASHLIAQVKNGTATVLELGAAGAVQYGLIQDGGVNCSGAEYPVSFSQNGTSALGFYAVAVAGVVPSTCLTWAQANAACSASGKLLPTNNDWTAGAKGTPTPGTDNGTTDCVIVPPGPANTGSRSGCVSGVGAYDMVGNVSEWVSSASEARGGTWSDATMASPFGADPYNPRGRGRDLGFRCGR